MKVLIVEDEPLLRQGLVKLIERFGLPINSVCEAGDGLEGLRKLAEEKPDIVITDIRMPEMNGLDFIREAKKIDPKLQFIIVSGYEEFEFAKKGMQYGVGDYLLKPVEHEELFGSLIRMMAKIEENRKNSSLNDELRLLQRRSDETSRERLLTKLIQQGEMNAAFEKDEKLASMQARFREFAVVLFELEIPALPYRSFLKGDEALLRFAASNVISQMMDLSSNEGMLFHHSIYDKEMVYILGDGKLPELSAVKRELEEIISGIHQYLRLELTIGIGMPVKQISEIHQSYQQAKQVLRDKIIHGRNKVYMPAPAIGARVNRISIIAEEDEQLIVRHLNECNAAAIHHWTERRLNAIVHVEEANFGQLEKFCADLYLLYRKYLLLQTNMPEWIIGEIDDLLSSLHGMDDWREAQGKIESLTNNIVENLNRQRLSSTYDVMDEIKRYIDANLHEPLSLQMIADRFFIHPNYFSRRFKERFKDSFVSYMTGERIRKAGLLLKDTELQIQQIAAVVGFPDAAYFSSVFRKSTGMTPIQYRMQAIC